ncbi:hypothetical protein BT69DRAFT_1259025 [Atractiella rhizophila]|nr:hypothetical protein BT69DRAFT_1259025 [Atractiella rhizophila]
MWDDYSALTPRRVFPVFRVTPKQNSLYSGFRIPAGNNSNIPTELSGAVLGARRQSVVIPRPLHDPMAESAVVLYDPTVDDFASRLQAAALIANAAGQEESEDSCHKSLAKILGIDKKNIEVDKVPVVIDPKVGKILRPHQVEGVKFLYKCVTGAVVDGQYGCIMADAMGLGKTLQCITLLWTLLRQSPIPSKPTIDKAIVACPASLVSNWANELDKWLGKGTVHPISVDGKLSKSELHALIRQWTAQRGRMVSQPVLIVSYEGLSRLTSELGRTEVGLLLCDEGHRLKNQDSQTYKLLKELNVKRRVLLTGTPIQNDLTEYFSLLNFINPGYLGTSQEFRKNYELAILRGRDSTCSDKERQLGEEKTRELAQNVNKFIIRRTNELLTKYLPVKYEHVVFCSLTQFQLDLYRRFLDSDITKALLKGKESQPLKAINLLKKLVNHPDLLDLANEIPGSEHVYPEGYNQSEKSSRREFTAELGGKMAVLERFLYKINVETTDKIVLISNFTQTLDLMEKLCRQQGYGYFRLDGTMTIQKRQKLVDNFNNPHGKEFVFLLSSKAGGCGINLIGANRLILFDPDWNPASDQQALARVWRDGQKKTCFVYRFIATGTVEEKIFQRQAQKQQLSSCVVDEKEDEIRHFSRNELRELFKLRKDTISDTHDMFKCKRCNKDGVQIAKAPAMLYGDTSTWNHFSAQCLAKIHDDMLRAETGLGTVSSVFQFVTTVA